MGRTLFLTLCGIMGCVIGLEIRRALVVGPNED